MNAKPPLSIRPRIAVLCISIARSASVSGVSEPLMPRRRIRRSCRSESCRFGDAVIERPDASRIVRTEARSTPHPRQYITSSPFCSAHFGQNIPVKSYAILSMEFRDSGFAVFQLSNFVHFLERRCYYFLEPKTQTDPEGLR